MVMVNTDNVNEPLKCVYVRIPKNNLNYIRIVRTEGKFVCRNLK